jgi:glycosyltransferase involved in cell wall biosynthesis
VNVVFVNHNSFASNSAVHVFHLANELVRLGVDCAVAVPKDVHTVQDLGTPRFRAGTYQEILRSPPPGCGPTLVHAWTPREIVRRYTEELTARLGCGYIVHLEDNEEHILERVLGLSIDEMRRRSDTQVPESLSHPVRYRSFLAGAAGVTALIEPLLEFKPAEIPGQIFWPAFDAELDWGMPRDDRLREQVGIARGERVVVYTGNVHAANQREVSSLYLALALLRRRGIPVRLVRTGIDFVPPYEPALAETMNAIVIKLGLRPRSELPQILSLADVLVQPGGPDPFNDYRFPSKLPEFLASGRPVLLPRSNIGRHLVDGEQCILLEAGNALEIARKLEPLMADEERRHHIGAGGRKFALQHLSWAKAAHQLQAFYESLARRRPRPSGGGQLTRDRDHAQDETMVR